MALVLTHITIIAVTVFLHRHQTHCALDLHPLVSRFFRLWLWLMKTKEWGPIICNAAPWWYQPDLKTRSVSWGQ